MEPHGLYYDNGRIEEEGKMEEDELHYDNNKNLRIKKALKEERKFLNNTPIELMDTNTAQASNSTPPLFSSRNESRSGQLPRTPLYRI